MSYATGAAVVFNEFCIRPTLYTGYFCHRQLTKRGRIWQASRLFDEENYCLTNNANLERRRS
jgi:hypothetical protein